MIFSLSAEEMKLVPNVLRKLRSAKGVMFEFEILKFQIRKEYRGYDVIFFGVTADLKEKIKKGNLKYSKKVTKKDRYIFKYYKLRFRNFRYDFFNSA